MGKNTDRLKGIGSTLKIGKGATETTSGKLVKPEPLSAVVRNVIIEGTQDLKRKEDMIELKKALYLDTNDVDGAVGLVRSLVKDFVQLLQNQEKRMEEEEARREMNAEIEKKRQENGRGDYERPGTASENTRRPSEPMQNIYKADDQHIVIDRLKMEIEQLQLENRGLKFDKTKAEENYHIALVDIQNAPVQKDTESLHQEIKSLTAEKDEAQENFRTLLEKFAGLQRDSKQTEATTTDYMINNGKLESERTKLNAQLLMLRANETKHEELVERLEDRIEDLKGEVAELERSYKKLHLDWEDQYNNLDEKRQDLEHQLSVTESQRLDFEHRLTESERKRHNLEVQLNDTEAKRQSLDNKLRDIRDIHQTDKERLRERHEEEKGRVESQYKTRVANLNEKHSTERASLISAHGAELDGAKRQLRGFQQKIDAAKEAASNELLAEQGRSAKAAQELQRAHGEEKRAVENRHKKEKTEIEKACEDEVIALKSKFDAEFAKLNDQLQKQQEKHDGEKSALAAKLADEKTRSTQNLEKLKENFNRERDEKKKDFDSRMIKKDEIIARQETDISSKYIAQIHALELEWKAKEDNYKEFIEKADQLVMARDKIAVISDPELNAKFSSVGKSVEYLGRLDWDRAGEHPIWTTSVLNSLSKNGVKPKKLKQQILKDTLWRFLFKEIFCSPFRILGEEGRELEIEWNEHFTEPWDDPDAQNELFTWPMPSYPSERWRYDTMKGCAEALEQPTSKWTKEASLRKSFRKSIEGVTIGMETLLGEFFTMDSSKSDAAKELIGKAARSWVAMVAQRCRIVIVMSDVDCDTAKERRHEAESKGFELVVTPGLRRFGSSKGDDLHIKETIDGCELSTFRISSK